MGAVEGRVEEKVKGVKFGRKRTVDREKECELIIKHKLEVSFFQTTKIGWLGRAPDQYQHSRILP